MSCFCRRRFPFISGWRESSVCARTIASPRSRKSVRSFLFGRSPPKWSRHAFSSIAPPTRWMFLPMRRVGFLPGFGGLAFSPKKLFRQEDRIYRINKSGFRKRGTPQNDPIGFALIHSRSVISVSSVVNFAGFGFSDPRKKQTLRHGGIHPYPNPSRRAELTTMSMWPKGPGVGNRAGGSAKWDRGRGDEPCR